MADLDPDQIALLNDNMRLMVETMGSLNSSLSTFANNLTKSGKAIGETEQALNKVKGAANELTQAEKALEEAMEEEAAVRAKLTQSYGQAKQAVLGFTDALISGERGFAKYSGAMRDAGDAAFNLGKAFGPLGAILGRIIKGGTMLAGAFAKQADNVLKATDDLSKMGTAGQFTAEEVRKMGARAGYASDQLDKLVKPIQSMGASLINLGGTAAQGAKSFSEIAAVGKETRKQYQRLGVSQEELTQAQADYIKLQQTSGQQITKSNRDLQKSSLAYVDNLLTLAALTGQDIESVKKKNELAMAEIETKIQNNLLDQEILRLKNTGSKADADRAAQLTREKEARDKLLQRVENEVGDPMLRKGLAKFLATGAITEEVAALKRIGVPIEQFAARIKKGEDVSTDFMNSLNKAGDAALRQVGYAAMFSEDTRKAFGISNEMLEYLAKTRGKEAQVREQAIADAKGKADRDPAQVARNKLTEAEIAAKLKLDELVASMNPLLTGFDQMDAKLKMLIAAVGVATIALTGLAAASAIGKLKDVLGGVTGQLGNFGRVLKSIAGGLTNTFKSLLERLPGAGMSAAGKVATGAAAGVVAVGTGIYQAYSGSREADRQLAAGEITAAEAKEKKQEARYSGAGVAIGGAAGAAIGTAIAGPLGTIVGGWLGSKAGEFIGSQLAKRDDNQNPEIKATQQKAEDETKKSNLAREKYALESQLQDQKLSEEERKFYQKKLINIQRQELWLENQEIVAQFRAAKDPEEKAMLLAKNQRLREEIANLDKQKALMNLKDDATEEERKVALDKLNMATEAEASVKIQRLNQQLTKEKDEKKREAILAEIESAKKEKDDILKKNAEFVANKGKDGATTDTTAAITPAIDEREAANWAYSVFTNVCTINDVPHPYRDKVNSILANPPANWGKAPAAQPASGSRDQASGTDSGYAGQRAAGGPIPAGKFALVGEEGPELISGPGDVTDAENTKKQLEQKLVKEFMVPFGKLLPELTNIIPTLVKNMVRDSQDYARGDKKIRAEAEALTPRQFEEWVKMTDAAKQVDIKKVDEKNEELIKLNKKLVELALKASDTDDEGKKNVLYKKAFDVSKEVETLAEQVETLVKPFTSALEKMDTAGDSVSVASPAGMTKTTSSSSSSSSYSSTSTSTPSEPKRGGIMGAVDAFTGALGFGSSAGDSADATPAGKSGDDKPPSGLAGGRKGRGGQMSEEDIKKMIIQHEGVRNRPYRDSLGLWTVGIGHLIGDGKTLPPSWNREFSNEEVMALFENDYQKHKKQAESNVPGFNKYDSIGKAAFIDLTFNMGPGWPKKFTNTSKKIEEGDTFGAARGLENSLWYKQVASRGPKIVDMVENATIQARDGGIAMGPKTGYPATLHGNEIIVPLDPNSVLAELGKKSQAQVQAEMRTITEKVTSSAPEYSKEILEVNKVMMETLASKLDNMINKLDQSNDIQDKILKYSQA